MSANDDRLSLGAPEKDPFREPTVLDQVARQARENARVAEQIEEIVTRRASTLPPKPTPALPRSRKK